MSRNITFADRTPSVYASQREQTVTFGTADFPAQVHIQSALDAADLEISEDYAGTSHNPFMVEAFTAAITAGNLSVFNPMPHKASVGRTVLIGQRFGIDGKRMERVFDSTIRTLGSMQDESRRYYLASVFLSADLHNLLRGTDEKATPFTIVNAINLCHRHGINNLFSVTKMVRLHTLNQRLLAGKFWHNPAEHQAIMNTINGQLAFIAAFTVPEIDRIMTEFTPDTYALPGRVKQAFGYKTLDEAISLINTTHTSLLESMLPVL